MLLWRTITTYIYIYRSPTGGDDEEKEEKGKDTVIEKEVGSRNDPQPSSPWAAQEPFS